MKEAFSGAEARGEPPTTNRPYKQTYGYDAFNHLTARTTAIWWTSNNSTSDTYVNNRHLPQGTAWQYDADGRLLTAPNAYKTYDAAGRNTYLDTYGYGTFTRGMDGDGQQIKTEETVWDEGWQNYITETKHYLRSSMLGGRVLTEIRSAAETRTFVYAGSTIIAWQGRTFGWESINWEHKDPSGASVRYGGYGQELDPFWRSCRNNAPRKVLSFSKDSNQFKIKSILFWTVRPIIGNNTQFLHTLTAPGNKRAYLSTLFAWFYSEALWGSRDSNLAIY